MSSFEYATDTIDVLIQLLTNTKQKLEEKDVLADHLYQTFDILQLIYTSIQDLHGNETLTRFQEEYTRMVIDKIREKVKDDNVLLSTMVEDGYYLIKMSVFLHGQTTDVCIINPFFKSISFIPSATTREMEEKIQELSNYHEEVENRIQELYLSKKNPLYYAKDDNLLLAKMTVQKKKYEKIIEEEIRENEETLLQLKNEIGSYKAELTNEKNLEIEKNYYRDEFLKKLKKEFGFRIMQEEM